MASSRIPQPPEVVQAAGVREVSEERAEPILARGTRDVADSVPRLGTDLDETAERVTLIAHDVKTPLSIIMLETQLLGERLSAVQSSVIQRGLERIAQNAAYIDRLVGDLLDLAKVDADALELRMERVNLALLLRETLERAVSSVDRRRVQLELRQTAYVSADRHRLERVVANLISNALKYSTAPVTVVLDLDETRARVTVVDRGRGLTPEQAATVFDRYRRVGTSRSRDGHGLGLYISRKIIHAHGGEIGVTSGDGVGCEFFFELSTID